jgi:hypothetical protein
MKIKLHCPAALCLFIALSCLPARAMAHPGILPGELSRHSMSLELGMNPATYAATAFNYRLDNILGGKDLVLSATLSAPVFPLPPL